MGCTVEDHQETTRSVCPCVSFDGRCHECPDPETVAPCFTVLNGHVHCDGDPTECSVEALQGEYAEVKAQRDRFRSALEVVYTLPAQSVVAGQSPMRAPTAVEVTAARAERLAALLEACEVAVTARCFVPAEAVPASLAHVLWTLGREVDRLRPGLADRMTARILELAQENR